MIELQGDFTQEHQMGPLLGKIVEGSIALFGPGRVVLALANSGALHPRVCHGVDPKQLMNPPYRKLWDLALESYNQKKGKLTSLAGSEGVTSIGNNKCMCAPLVFKRQCIGTLVLEGNYSQEDYQRFQLFTNQAAIAIGNAREFEKLRGTPSPKPSPLTGVISASDVSEGTSLIGLVSKYETQVIEHVVKQFHGNKTLAAKSLGITRGTLYNKLNYDKTHSPKKPE